MTGSILTAFAAGLTDPEAKVPDGVVDPQGRPAPKRYAVYRNNVTVSLGEVIQSAYPAVAALIGEAPFELLARQFARAHPPTSAVMMHYGAGFDAFLASIDQLSHLPFLPDVARLEWAWIESYHAADEAVLDPKELAAIAPEQWDNARFVAHPAARLIESRFPLMDIWEAGRSGAGAGIDPNQSQWALVTRPDVDVQVLAVSPSSGPFVRDLLDGVPLGEAVAARAGDNNFDLQRAMSRILPAGSFCALELNEQE